MRSSFTRDLIVGSIIGASVSMMMNPDMMKNRSRRRMMRTGKDFLKKSGSILGDVVEMLR